MSALHSTPTSVVPPIAPVSPNNSEAPPQDGGIEPYRFSVDQYRKLGEAGILTPESRVELIDGFIVCKPMQNPRHIEVLGNLVLLASPLSGAAWVMRSQAQVNLQDSSPEPDLVFLRGPKSKYSDRHAVARDIGLIVEVSDTSLNFDSQEKLRIYARSSISVYWVVNIPAKRVEVYSSPSDDTFENRADFVTGQSAPVVLDGVTVAEFAVSDIFG